MRLGLGTVQFGLDYGVANREGKTEAKAVASILELAAERGIRVLDTAHAYGDSESVLGGSLRGLGSFAIVTKTPANLVSLASARGVASQRVQEAFAESLRKLRVSQVHGLLVHHGADLLSPAGEEVYATLQSLQAAGKVHKIGASVYSPEELQGILDRFKINLVQLPLNPLDQRFVESGILRELALAGIEVHTRSAFLQGLFALPPAMLPPHFAPVRPLLERFHAVAEKQNLNSIDACLAFSLSQSDVGAVICGVDSRRQLQELCEFSATTKTFELDFSEFAYHDPRILEPRHWPKA